MVRPGTRRAAAPAGGELLTVWPPAPFESAPTHCFRLGDDIGLSRRVSAARFRADAPRVFAFPSDDGDPGWFREVVSRSWLPAIYPFWGRQVLHASGIALADSDHVVAFTGPTHSASPRPLMRSAAAGWRLVADDTLAFAWSPRANDRFILFGTRPG